MQKWKTEWLYLNKNSNTSWIWACSIFEFVSRFTKSRFWIVLLFPCMVPYIFLHAKIFFNNIFTFICKLCLYNLYLCFLYLCVCQMNWFSNLITFYFLFLCKHQVHLIVMLTYLSFYSQKNFFTFLCGCYCLLWTINCMMQRSVRDILCMLPHVLFVPPLRDLWQETTFHVFARFQNISNCSIWFYGRLNNRFLCFLLWLWRKSKLWLKIRL